MKITTHNDSALITGISLPLTGSFDNGDLQNIIFRRGVSLVYGSSEFRESININAEVAPHTVVFTEDTNIPANSIQYILFGVEVDALADVGHTIKAGKPTFTFTTDGTVVDNMTDTAGLKTFI